MVHSTFSCPGHHCHTAPSRVLGIPHGAAYFALMAYGQVLFGVQLLSSGADGLMKLWSVRTTECLNTFDGHEDKVCCVFQDATYVRQPLQVSTVYGEPD